MAPQFDFSRPNYTIFRTKDVNQSLTNDIKSSSFYLDTVFYKAAIELMDNGNKFEVLFEVDDKGICIQIQRYIYESTEEGFLNFNIGIPKSFYNKTRGILGYFDGSNDTELYERGNMNNKISNPHGNHVDMESCELLSINNFGEISLDVCGVSFLSLFSGAVTKDDPEFFTSPLSSRKKRQSSLPPVPPSFDQLNITDEMIELCNNMTACLYDFAVTGNVAIAGQTRDFADNTTSLEKQLSMKIS